MERPARQNFKPEDILKGYAEVVKALKKYSTEQDKYIDQLEKSVKSYDTAKKEELLLYKKLENEVEDIFKWECPTCETVFYSEDGDRLTEFIRMLFNYGVRYKVMEMMEGVFCQDCYEDPEIYGATL